MFLHHWEKIASCVRMRTGSSSSPFSLDGSWAHSFWIASFQMREILRRLNPVWRASRDGQVRRGRESVLQEFDSHGVSIEKKKDSCGLMCVYRRKFSSSVRLLRTLRWTCKREKNGHTEKLQWCFVQRFSPWVKIKLENFVVGFPF